MNYKKLFSFLFVCLILFLIILSWIKQPEIKNADSSGLNIIAFGDSLVYGTGASQRGETDMFSLVSKELGVNIINKGVPGDTTADGLERLESDVLSQNPRIVLVLLGGNDYLRKIPKEQTFLNLESIIQKIQEKGAVVILMGVRGGLLDHFENDFERLAKKYHTGYVSNVLEGIILNRELMYDGVHPNDKGYKIISMRVSPSLESVLELSK